MNKRLSSLIHFALAGTLSFGLVAAASARELRLAHFMSPMHHMHKRMMQPLADKLALETGGEVTIRIFPSGELSKSGAAQWRTALTGVADITFGLQGYTSETFPRTMFAVAPGLFHSSAEATTAMWENIDALAPDYERARLLAMWAAEPAIIMTKDVPIRTLNEMKGLKIRTADQVGAAIVQTLGATPVPLPASEMYTAIDTGVIDGIMSDASTIESFKLQEVANYFTVGLPSSTSAYFLVMNRRSFDGLTADQQAALNALTGRDLSMAAASSYATEASRGLDMVRAAGKTIIEVEPEVLEDFNARSDIVMQLMLKSADEAGVNGEAIVEGLRSSASATR
ncbi:TRAP transporter substrate-binding protein [Nitratireductor sp. OM-1]|uniref:TRAP transporter substrate-binding protein n=1 Tax=Nitratireductor sp. OM-1 TaxID=1756988 RepID=UPI000DDD085F|nr:TRAP transporter substrate-binding protein [Nitratireductor sp. OM-1]